MFNLSTVMNCARIWLFAIRKKGESVSLAPIRRLDEYKIDMWETNEINLLDIQYN